VAGVDYRKVASEVKEYGSRWVGMRVWHNVYGRGRVVSRVMGTTQLCVQFDSGEMRIMDPHSFSDWEDA